MKPRMRLRYALGIFYYLRETTNRVSFSTPDIDWQSELASIHLLLAESSWLRMMNFQLATLRQSTIRQIHNDYDLTDED